MRGQQTRLDGVTIEGDNREVEPRPGVNRHTELDIAPSEQALRYEAAVRAARRDQLSRASGRIQTPTMPATLRSAGEMRQELEAYATSLRLKLEAKAAAQRAFRRDCVQAQLRVRAFYRRR